MLEDIACPTCGSCSGMFTANSMNCLMEALGLALPFNGTALARSAEREDAGPQSRGTHPRSGSTGHPPARYRHRRGPGRQPSPWIWQWAARPTPSCIPWPSPMKPAWITRWSGINAVADRVPHLCKVQPAGKLAYRRCPPRGRRTGHSERSPARNGHAAPGPHDRHRTQSGELDQPAPISATKRSSTRADNAHSQRGGLAILFGNLAPKGAVVKTGGVDSRMQRTSGPAKIYEIRRICDAGIMAGQVAAGDVVVIRYEGPRGGPGMQEMLSPTSAPSWGWGWATKWP